MVPRFPANAGGCPSRTWFYGLGLRRNSGGAAPTNTYSTVMPKRLLVPQPTVGRGKTYFRAPNRVEIVESGIYNA